MALTWLRRPVSAGVVFELFGASTRRAGMVFGVGGGGLFVVPAGLGTPNPAGGRVSSNHGWKSWLRSEVGDMVRWAWLASNTSNSMVFTAELDEEDLADLDAVGPVQASAHIGGSNQSQGLVSIPHGRRNFLFLGCDVSSKNVVPWPGDPSAGNEGLRIRNSGGRDDLLLTRRRHGSLVDGPYFNSATNWTNGLLMEG